MKENEIRRIFKEFEKALRHLRNPPLPPIQKVRQREEILELLRTYQDLQVRIQSAQLQHQLMVNIDHLTRQIEELRQKLELPILIQIESPKDGDSFLAGDTLKVEWRIFGPMGNILEAALYQGNNLIKYLGRYPNTGSLYWSIPKFYPSLSQLTIKLIDPLTLATGISGTFSISGGG
jgi:hypothetical protein